MRALKDGALSRQTENFKSLIEIATSMGASFNPVKDHLKLNNLNTLHENATKAVSDWMVAENALQRATSLRKDEFNKLNSFVSLINKEVKISRIKGEVADDILNISKQIRGSRKMSKTGEENTASANTAESKISYKNATIEKKLDTFERLVEILDKTPEYESSYPELQIAALKDKFTSLKNLQQNYLSALMTLQNERSKRDSILDDPENGLIIIGQNLKDHLRIYFKNSKTQLKTISAIKMTKRKN